MRDPTTAHGAAARARRRTLLATLRFAEGVLATAGVVCSTAYAVACARAAWTQSTQSYAFDEALRARLTQESPNRAEWSQARVAKYEASLETPVQAIGRLEIPDADISVMVLEGTDETTLDRAVGHIEGTARPGEPGNLGIAGHRDGYFRGLRHLEVGDDLTLTTLDGVAHYQVVGIDVVAPARVEVLQPTQEPTLTLVTCYPFYHVGDAPKRYVVRAQQVRYEAWRPLRNGAV